MKNAVIRGMMAYRQYFGKQIFLHCHHEMVKRSDSDRKGMCCVINFRLQYLNAKKVSGS